jgi:hypothetical protein
MRTGRKTVKAKTSRRERKTKKPQAIPSMVWDKDSYAHVSPGRYSAVATRVQGPEWVTAFGRWSILVEFELLSESVPVCAFYNLGTDPKQLYFGRKSKYVRDWTIANGEPPRRGDSLDPQVFLCGQVFELEVGDSLENPDQEQKRKTDDEAYSRVTKMISAVRPSLHSPNQEFKNQESRINQSNNQLINQSRTPSLNM